MPRSPLVVTVVMNGQTYEEDLAQQADLSNDPAGLNAALDAHAGRFAWWAMLEVEARDEYETLQRALVIAESNAQLVHETAGKVADVKARVNLDPTVVQLREAVGSAKTQMDRLAVGRKTMVEKREALVEMARNFREEFGSVVGGTVRDRAAEARDRLEQWQARQQKGRTST